MNIGIILAAGKGTRLNSTTQNKTVLPVAGKPMILYGVELFEKTLDQTVVVVGAFADSVKTALANHSVLYADQTEQAGTGHAVRIAVDAIQLQGLTPEFVIVGYGDHMMYYQEEMVTQLIAAHSSSDTAISLVTTHHQNPNELAWGRIIRNEGNFVERIVEQKEATEQEKNVTELNAGFYCFNYSFLLDSLPKLTPSPITNEYYLTDLIGFANHSALKVVPIEVDFAHVGSGINTVEQLTATNSDLKS